MSDETEIKIDEATYKELEAKYNAAIEENGKYNQLFTNVEPYLQKLDSDPSLIQAIIDDKLTPEITEAIVKNKFTITEQDIINKAKEEVNKDLSKEGVKNIDKDEYVKKLEDKISDLEKKFEQSNQDLKMKEEVADFISRTKDFEDYSIEIEKWVSAHPEIQDIEIAYNVVKGKVLSEKFDKENEIRAAEEAKKIAMNGGGGNGYDTANVKTKEELIDKLIAFDRIGTF